MLVLGFPLALFASTAWAQKYIFGNAVFGAGLRPIWVITGDFNQDGIPDLVVVNECGSDPACLSAGSISVLLGKPDGTFQRKLDVQVHSNSRTRCATRKSLWN